MPDPSLRRDAGKPAGYWSPRRSEIYAGRGLQPRP
jgi:hypothetical protein